MSNFRIALLCLLPVMNNCTQAADMKTISEVKSTYETKLLNLPDVVSVGIGQDAKGNQVITVGLACDNTKTRALVPEKLEGYHVIVKIPGTIRAQ